MQTIKIYLKESGSVAELVKDFNLYAGSYQNKLLDVYVPISILYTATDIDNGVKVGGLLIAPNGSQITTKSYYLNFVRNETVFNEFEQKDIEYAVYERLLPKEFTLFSGDQNIVTNVVAIDNTDEVAVIKQIVTTQTATMVVNESAYLDEEQPVDPSELDIVNAKVSENSRDIVDLQGRMITAESNILRNAEEISKNAQEIEDIKTLYAQPEEYIGQMNRTNLPNQGILGAFVKEVKQREPKNADVVIVVLEVRGGTDKIYKYIYSDSGWNGYEIPPMETARNGEKGLIEGTFNIGSSNNTIVDIVGGQIVNIYVKDSTGTLRNVQEYSNTLKSSIDDIISGKTQVGNSLKATQDGFGNNIASTYLNKNEGATKDYVKNYALPKQFNDVSYITDGGYSENIPSVSFSATSSTVGSTQLFDITKTAGAKYQISNKNSYDNVVFISASANCTVEFRLTTKIKGQVVNVEVNDNINLTAGGISRITFRDTFDYLEENVLRVEENDIIEQILEVITSTSETIVFTVYSNSIYPSKFYLNTQLTVIKTSSGSLGEQLILGADGVLEANNYNFTVQDFEEYEVYKKNGTKFLVDLFLPVVGDLINTNKVSITFGDTTYWIFNVLHGASKHATIGDLKQVQHYTNDLGYRWICEMTYFENKDLSGFAIIPTISMSDVLSLTSDEMDNYLADGGLAQGQLAICGKLINNGYVEGALYRFDIVYPYSYTWTILSKTSSITKVTDSDITTDELKGIVYLTEKQYGDLIRDGQITVNNETIVYSDDVQYITPDTSYSIIQGTEAPTSETKGQIGQFYLRTIKNNINIESDDEYQLYICTNIFIRNDDTIYNWKLLSVEEALESLNNLQSTVSDLVPDVARALKIPMTTPIEPKLVTVNTSNSQEMISLGDEFEIKNDELKLTGVNVSNPNLLINGDFRVNQREQTSYGGNRYTVDRWNTVQLSTNVQVIDKGVRVSFSQQYSKFRQYIEDVSSLEGKRVTLSAKISNLNNLRNNLQLQLYQLSDTNVIDETIRVPITGNGIVQVSGVIGNNITKLATEFYTWASGTEVTTFDVEWVKLEIGSVATAFSPRPYAEELAICQRYYQKLRINDTQYCANVNAIYPNIKLIQTMRTRPTISVITYPSIRGNGSNLGVVDNLTPDALKDNILLCATNASSLGVVLGQLYMITNGEITADAEIY